MIGALALVATLLALAEQAGAGEAVPVLPTVTVFALPDLTRLEAVVPGRVIDYALPRSADGKRDVVLLVGEVAEEESTDDDETEERRLPPCPGADGADGGPKTLYRIRTADPPSLEKVRDGLPADATALGALDLDADGSDEVLLSTPGKLHAVGVDGLRLLVEDRDLVWDPEPRLKPLGGVVASSGVGQFRVHGPFGEPPAWGVRNTASLPIRARLTRTGLTIENPRPTLVEQTPDGNLVFATEPEAHGNRRLRVLLVTLLSAGGATAVECWCRLPGAEELLSANFVRIDGQMLLLVATRNAEKLSLFAERRLRLFSLQPDRSRMGLPPVWAVDSQMNLWQAGSPVVLDVDQDGRQDLVLGYWKGLADSKVVLDAYPRSEDGWFEASPRTTAFNVDHGDRTFLEYGTDLTGDGTPDLLLRSGGRLVVHPGKLSRSGKNLVDTRALATLEVGASDPEPEVEIVIGTSGGNANLRGTALASLRPAVVDLNGDGTAEILAVTADAGGTRSTFHAVQLH